MSSAELHRQKKPHARSTTLQYLDKRDKTTERLKKEIAAARRRKVLSWLLWIWRRG